MKQAVIVLLPVFWLVTLSYAPFESSACARPAGWTVAGLPAGDGDAAPLSDDPCCFSHDQLRHCARRHVWDRSDEKHPLAGLRSSDRPFSPIAVIAAVPPAGEAFSLQQRWQFIWRTAAPPRAPTFLA